MHPITWKCIEWSVCATDQFVFPLPYPRFLHLVLRNKLQRLNKQYISMKGCVVRFVFANNWEKEVSSITHPSLCSLCQHWPASCSWPHESDRGDEQSWGPPAECLLILIPFLWAHSSAAELSLPQPQCIHRCWKRKQTQIGSWGKPED